MPRVIYMKIDIIISHDDGSRIIPLLTVINSRNSNVCPPPLSFSQEYLGDLQIFFGRSSSFMSPGIMIDSPFVFCYWSEEKHCSASCACKSFNEEMEIRSLCKPMWGQKICTAANWIIESKSKNSWLALRKCFCARTRTIRKRSGFSAHQKPEYSNNEERCLINISMYIQTRCTSKSMWKRRL